MKPTYHDDFAGIMIGDLVRPVLEFSEIPLGTPVLVVERELRAVCLGEDDCEQYEAILIVLHENSLHPVSIHEVERVEGLWDCIRVLDS